MLHISAKKLLQNFVVIGAHKVVEIVFDPTLTLIFSIHGEPERGKLYILKKIDLSAFKEIWEYVYNSALMFFT